MPAEAGELFGLLAERSEVLLWCTDAKGRCTWVGPRWPRLTGLEAEAFLGMGWVRAVHPEDVASVRNAFRRAVTLRGAARLEFRARWAGGWRYVSAQAVPRLDERGALRSFVAVATDVDARRRLERALRSAVEIRIGRSETETLQSLARGLADVLDVKFAGFARLEERDGEGWARLLAGWLDGAAVEELEYRLAGTPCAVTAQEEFCRVDRDVVERFPDFAPLAAMGVQGYAGLRLYDSEGAPIGIAIIADGEPFEGKSELYSTLKLFGARAAAELERGRTEASLRTARTRAEASSAAKGEFLASMSHEIRTPLNGVLGMTQLLLDTDLSDVQREYIGTIESSGNALLGVINDILDFSKIEAGKLSVESILIDPWALAEDVTVLLAEQARRGGNRFGTFIRPDVPRHLLSDPTRVRQVLLNFCSNALKFTEHGEVYLHAEVVPGEQPLLRFEVRDTGCGIAPDVQAHLFDAFSQADDTITRRFGGTGLGLAISKRLVRLMGGEIGVESEVGVGSTFWFTIPLVGARCDLKARQVFDPLHPRIVCLTPFATTRAALAAHLEDAGAMVRAQGPDAALPGPAIAPDLIVVEAPAVFRDFDAWRARHAGVPLVLLNPLANPLTPGERRQLGVAAVLSTPLRASQLVTALRGVLSQQEPGAPLPGDRGPARREAHATGRTLRVLLVEDNPVNQRVALAMLAGMDCVVDVAENGVQGVEAARRATYDLILMDCQMPEMSGYDATALLRTEETDPPRHIVALTADVLAPDRERCLAAGMNDYVSKPVRRETLRAVVEARRHALERGAARPV